MAPNETAARAARVLIVDDHPAVREALAARVSQHPELSICGEAVDATDALQLIAEKKPDLVVVDIGLKNSNGLDLIKRIKTRFPKVKSIVWSMHRRSMYAERALRAGAMGYITKEQATEKILVAIQQVLAGQIYVSEDLAPLVMPRLFGNRTETAKPSGIETLSDRELEVFELIGNGLTTLQIATRMHVSPKTVETYRVRIKEKLGVENVNELIQHAVQWGMQNT